ncbi:hypothetical protein Goklo_024053, partial [Gossypium klotzschianum]|nr:hypothetical protein [Gossypium klotzschianum]
MIWTRLFWNLLMMGIVSITLLNGGKTKQEKIED